VAHIVFATMMRMQLSQKLWPQMGRKTGPSLWKAPPQRQRKGFATGVEAPLELSEESLKKTH
jgi:hypothetical protein